MTIAWTEAEIAAFMAGRLTGRDADRVAEALETDPAAQAAAERLADAPHPTDALLREAFAAPLSEPVPAALRAAVLAEPGKVAAFPARKQRGWVPMALAASLALAVGLGGGFGAGWGLREKYEPAVAVGPVSGPALAALDAAPSGDARGRVAPTASFIDGSGRVCREFDALDASGAVAGAGVACRDGGGWRVLVLAAVEGPAGTGDGYAPAGGAAADPVGAVLDALDAGPALSPAEEAALIARGWRRD